MASSERIPLLSEDRNSAVQVPLVNIELVRCDLCPNLVDRFGGGKHDRHSSVFYKKLGLRLCLDCAEKNHVSPRGYKSRGKKKWPLCSSCGNSIQHIDKCKVESLCKWCWIRQKVPANEYGVIVVKN